MKLINFYEVMDRKGDLIWGGASAREAVTWFRRNLDSSIFVSVWDEESEEDFRLLNDRIDITNLLLATILSEKKRDYYLVKPAHKSWERI